MTHLSSLPGQVARTAGGSLTGAAEGGHLGGAAPSLDGRRVCCAEEKIQVGSMVIRRGAAVSSGFRFFLRSTACINLSRTSTSRKRSFLSNSSDGSFTEALVTRSQRLWTSRVVGSVGSQTGTVSGRRGSGLMLRSEGRLGLAACRSGSWFLTLRKLSKGKDRKRKTSCLSCKTSLAWCSLGERPLFYLKTTSRWNLPWTSRTIPKSFS